MKLLGVVSVKSVTSISLMPHEMDNFEMYNIEAKDNRIVITPASPTCPFCGRVGVRQLHNYYVCNQCAEQLIKQHKGDKK